MTDDDAVALGAGTRLDWLVDHERKVAADKAAVAQWAERMERAAPGSADRDRARERMEDAARLLRVHSEQLTRGRADVVAARRRTALAAQRRRPALVLTVVQAVVVVVLAVVGLVASLPWWGWTVVLLGAGLCAVQMAVARADDRAGWPPPAAGGTCALLVLAGLAGLGVLPGWVAVVAVAAILLIGVPAAIGWSFDLEAFAGGKQA